MHQCIEFLLFCSDTLHVSDGLSVHHQQFTTVHRATGICQTDTSVCLLASKTNQMHQCIKFNYFGMTLYMFRTVFPSIVSSSRLYIQQQAFVKQILLSACQPVKPTRCTNVSNLFYFAMTLYMFRAVFPSIIRVQDCTYSNRHLSNRYCCLLASK